MGKGCPKQQPCHCCPLLAVLLSAKRPASSHQSEYPLHPLLSLVRVQRWQSIGRSCGEGAEGAGGANTHHSICLLDSLHRVVGESFPRRGHLQRVVFCFQKEGTFLWEGQASRLCGHSQLGSPTRPAIHCLEKAVSGLRECARGCTLLLLPSACPGRPVPRIPSVWPDRVFPLRLALGTATGSRAEAGRCATAQLHAPQNPLPAPASGQCTHRHSLPSVLLSSALCRCGY